MNEYLHIGQQDEKTSSHSCQDSEFAERLWRALVEAGKRKNSENFHLKGGDPPR